MQIIHTAKDKAKANERPTIEMMVSHTDHVFSVSGTLRLRYSFTSQNPPSFTCEKISDPAPVAMASSSGMHARSVQRDGRHDAGRGGHGHGCRSRSQPDQRSHRPRQAAAATRGCAARWRPWSGDTPLSWSTRPNPPPAPTSSVIDAVGARHSLLKRRIISRENPRILPRVKKLTSTPTSSAMSSLPARRSA